MTLADRTNTDIAPPFMKIPQDKLGKILVEAALQLNAKGVSHTSLSDIAEAAGLSRAGLYYYVKDRQDLVFQCYRRASETILQQLEKADHSKHDAVEVLSRFVSSMLAENEPPIAAHSDIALLNTAQRAEIELLNEKIYRRLGKVLRQGHQQGLLRHCDVTINARSILSLITWAPFAQIWVGTKTMLSNSRIIENVMTVILEGYSGTKTIPRYNPIDLSDLIQTPVGVFDRAGLNDAKKEALLTHASRLFNHKGIDATSLEEIAAQVGVSKRTLHRLVGSKQALIMACCQRGYRIFNYIRDAMTAYRGTRLEALAAAHHALAIAYPREDLSPMSMLVGVDSLTQDQQDELEQSLYTLGAGYYTAIVFGISQGCIGDIDVECHSLMLPGLLSWLARSNVPTDRKKREKIASEIAALVAVGLRKQ